MPSPSKSALDLTTGVGEGEAVAVAVAVDVDVAVGVAVGVFVGVCVGVLVGVAVGVFVGVCVGVFVGVDVGVLVAVAVGVFVGVRVGVLVGVRVGVFVGVEVGVFVGVRVGVLVGVEVGVFSGVDVAVGVGPPPVMVKFASEISKKMFPTASILILAAVVAVFGTVTLCDPSFAVLATRTVGNVVPPSVESEILTLAALMGALVVFATFQVTVWVEPPAYDTAVFGDVTTNGPLLPSTDRVDVAERMPPAAEWLSRATT